MKKRLFSSLLVITMTFAFAVNGFAIPVVPTETETVLVQTFESETVGSAPADWVLSQGGQVSGTASTFDVFSDSNGKHMRMVNPNTSRTDNAIKTLSDAYTGHITVSFKFHNKAAVSYNTISLLDASDNEVAKFGASKTSLISYSTYYSASFTYNTWHDIVFDVDTNAKTYDFYYDGTKLNSEAVPFVSDAAANVKKIKIALSQANTLMFDDFVVRKDRSNAVDEVTLISDDFESETNGAQITASNSVGAWSRVSGPDYVEGTTAGGEVKIGGTYGTSQYLSFHNTSTGSVYTVKRPISNYDGGVVTELGGVLEVSMSINAQNGWGRFYVDLKDASGNIITTLSYGNRGSSGEAIAISNGDTSFKSSFTGTGILGNKAHKLIIDTDTKKIAWSVGGVQQAVVDYKNAAAGALSYVEIRTNPTTADTYYLVDNFTIKSININPLESITFDTIKGSNTNAKNVNTDLSLPATNSYLGLTYDVAWSSSNTSVISNAGVVTTPAEDTIVTLTASSNGKTKSFKVIVPSEGTVLLFQDFESYDVGDVRAEAVVSQATHASFTITDESGNKVQKLERTVTGNSSKNLEAIDTISNVSSGIIELSTKIKMTASDNVPAIQLFRTSTSMDDTTYDLSIDTLGNLRMLIPTGLLGIDRWLTFGPVTLNDWFKISLRMDLDAKSIVATFEQDGTKIKRVSTLTTDSTRWNRLGITDVRFYSARLKDGTTSGSSTWYADDLIVKRVNGLTDSQFVAEDKEYLNVPSVWDGNFNVLSTRGPLGSSDISWATSDASVIATDGSVVFSNEPKDVTLTATITKGEVTDTKTFNVKVIGKNILGIAGISYDNGTSNPTAGAKAESVSVLLDANGSGTKHLLIGQYSGEEHLTKFVAKAVSLGSESETIDISEDGFVVPEDMTGYALKAFLWDMPTLTPLSKQYATNENRATKLFIIGDSIATMYTPPTEHATAKYQQGWGQVIDNYFLPSLEVVNLARGGYKTVDYFLPERLPDRDWDTAILPQISAGDFVIVSLGINDASAHIAESVYKEKLATFASDTKAKGAEIIFVTPTAETTDGTLHSRATAYAGYMREQATASGATLIDLQPSMLSDFGAYRDTYGFEALKNEYYCSFNSDYLHINNDGAHYVAQKIIDLVKASSSGLKNYVR